MSVSDAKIVSRKALDATDAKWIRLMSTTYKDPTGKQRLWEYAERSTRPKSSEVDCVGIVAVLQDKSKDSKDTNPHILLQKQFRAPVGKVCIEVPAGLVDPDESVETCAVRELKEETGYVGEVIAGDFGCTPVMWNDPGFCNTNLHMLHLTIDTSLPENKTPKPALEDSEFIECFTVPLKDLYAECKRLANEGFAIDARVGTVAEGVEIAKQFGL